MMIKPAPTNAAILVLTAALLQFGLIPVASCQAGDQQPTNQISIEQPRDGDRVESMITVKGTIMTSGNNGRPWVVVRPAPKNNDQCHFRTEKWYPQREPEVDHSKGTWEADATLGGDNPLDNGCKYEIAAIVVANDSELQKKINDFFRKGDLRQQWVPISLVPQENVLTTSRVVTVTRTSR